MKQISDGSDFHVILAKFKSFNKSSKHEGRDWHIRPLELQVGDSVLRIYVYCWLTLYNWAGKVREGQKSTPQP